MTHIIYCRYADNEHRPYGRYEDSQYRGHDKGIDRGMEIEMLPRIGPKHLQRCVERGRACHNDTEQGGIEGINITHMHQMGILQRAEPHNIYGRHDNHQYHRQHGMGAREEHDKLRYRICRHHGGEHLLLMYPPQSPFLTDHLHPHRIDAILWQDVDVRNCQVLIPWYREGIGLQLRHMFLRLL